jgi:hypothetical protein
MPLTPERSAADKPKTIKTHKDPQKRRQKHQNPNPRKNNKTPKPTKKLFMSSAKK